MASPKQCRPKSAPCRSRSPPEQPLRVKVVGLFKSSSFQVAKSAAEALKTNYPSKFEDPIIVPLQEFAWDQYLQEKKRELKNEIWEYSSYVMCFVNDQLLGDAFDLQKWAQKMWDIVDFKPPELYEALTVDYAAKFLTHTKHAFVFLDISIDFYPIGRLVFELYCDSCPKTCRNFQVLCTGKAEFSQSGIRLHYVGSIFHRVVPNGWIQGGDEETSLKKVTNIKIEIEVGAWVAQWVKASAFGSGHDPRVLGSSPASGSLLGREPASYFSLSACLSAYL
ncbi:probable inactive peptidyl-prolyl cis-trans isomerase-like 6 isoform X2 [Mustela nigripes]|uniref:probable inactive peptidyl-prolyl cis-trans isomerase-like 6 isoform X2 n=1 Tax=Mustela nigripes TaxID=77151 RepID=UPI0028157AF8|nr:probable inactive peptidyl-prolyl cis-trans isomerase-like 6 isoform X2 [Mustela nigripes]